MKVKSQMIICDGKGCGKEGPHVGYGKIVWMPAHDAGHGTRAKSIGDFCVECLEKKFNFKFKQSDKVEAKRQTYAKERETEYAKNREQVVKNS